MKYNEFKHRIYVEHSFKYDTTTEIALDELWIIHVEKNYNKEYNERFKF